MRRVAVFPAHVLHAPVVEDAWIPVGILVVGEPVHLAGGRIEAVEVRHLHASGFAGKPLLAGVGREYDAPVRQPAAVRRLVDEFGGQKLLGRLSFDIDLEQPPGVAGGGIGRDEKDPLRVEFKIDGMDRGRRGWPIQLPFGNRVPVKSGDDDERGRLVLLHVQIVVAGKRRQGRVLLVTRRQALGALIDVGATSRFVVWIKRVHDAAVRMLHRQDFQSLHKRVTRHQPALIGQKAPGRRNIVGLKRCKGGFFSCGGLGSKLAQFRNSALVADKVLNAIRAIKVLGMSDLGFLPIVRQARQCRRRDQLDLRGEFLLDFLARRRRKHACACNGHYHKVFKFSHQAHDLILRRCEAG